MKTIFFLLPKQTEGRAIGEPKLRELGRTACSRDPGWWHSALFPNVTFTKLKLKVSAHQPHSKANQEKTSHTISGCLVKGTFLSLQNETLERLSIPDTLQGRNLKKRNLITD